MDNGGLGMSTKQFNEDVGDKTMADVTREGQGSRNPRGVAGKGTDG